MPINPSGLTPERADATDFFNKLTHRLSEGVKQIQRLQRMYNLTVAQVHPLFVGQQQWLVHNTCPIGGGSAFVESQAGHRVLMPFASTIARG